MANNANPTAHDLISTVARCLSGQWLIDPTWLHQHSDLMTRADKGEDMSAMWPKMSSTVMVAGDGGYQAAAPGSKASKGAAVGQISVVGPVYKYGWNSSKTLLWMLDQLAKDDQVGAVVAKVDSPGGQSAGTREVYEAVLNYPKPLLVKVDGMLLSAAMYQWAGATKIVATQPNDMIGAIGTFSSVADWNAYYESFGLKIYETYASKSTEKNEEVRQLFSSNGKDRALMQAYMDGLNDQFIMDVRAGRGKQLNKDVEKGRMYFAPEAKEMGLIDDQVQEAETFALVADMYASSNKSIIQMGLLDDFKALIAKAEGGKSEGGATEPTAEQLADQVATLTTQLTASAAQVTKLTTERDTATAQVTTLNSTVATLTTERDSLQTKVTAYGAQPGAMGTVVQKKEGDKIPAADGDPKSLTEFLASLPSEQKAAEMFPE